MNYYSAMRSDELLPFVTTWKELEGGHIKQNRSEGEKEISYDLTQR